MLYVNKNLRVNNLLPAAGGQDLQRALDQSWDWGRDGQMGSLWVESVLISGVADLDWDTFGAGVAELALGLLKVREERETTG